MNIRCLFRRAGLPGFALAVLTVTLLLNVASVSAQETPAANPPAVAEIPEEEKPFWDSAQAFVDAYAKRDLDAIGELFTEDAEFLDEFGEQTIGRESIKQLFADVFGTDPEASIDEVIIMRVRFLSDTVVMEEGYVIASESKTEARHRSRYIALHSKGDDGKWRINTLKDYPRESAGRPEQLAQLRWLLGDWVNEDTETVVHTTCDWSPDGNYLMRHFNVQRRDGGTMTGVQRIGWDPALNKLRSWTFDSEGGFFQGLWTEDDGRWLLTAHGITSAGESVTGTSVYTVIDDEMVTWHYDNLIIGGEVRGDKESITMVKRPPSPQQAAK